MSDHDLLRHAGLPMLVLVGLGAGAAAASLSSTKEREVPAELATAPHCMVANIPTQVQSPDAMKAYEAAEPPLWNDLGSLTYPVTTKSKEAQSYFDQGLRMAANFNHAEARRAFHLGLLAAAGSVRRGDWQLCDATGWPEDQSCAQLLAWTWTDEGRRSLVVVNFADAPASARVHVPWTDLGGRTWRLHDLLSDDAFERDGTEVAAEGLYVHLPAWASHVLTWSPL